MNRQIKKKKWMIVLYCLIFCGVIMSGVRSRAASEPGVKSVSLGNGHEAVIKEDGSLWMWGDNHYGQLGDGTTEDRTSPVKIMDHVRSVSLGASCTAAVKEDGSLWTWGYNGYGILGDGTEVFQRNIPVKIMDQVQSVSLGCYHGAAVKTDGNLWMWGSNYAGQLGDGTTLSRSVPVKVLDHVSCVSLGEDHSGAVKTDGSLWVWGSDTWSGLEEEGVDRKRPVKMMDGVASVSLGTNHSAVIKTDGSLWIWGYNFRGELGNGTTEYSYVPMKIMDDVESISLGEYHSGAIKTDGSLWIWGENEEGQLGNGGTEDVAIPMKLLDQAEQICLKDSSSAVIKRDGSLWMWGTAGFRNGGNGTRPVKVIEGTVSSGNQPEPPVSAEPSSEYFVLGKDNNQFQHTGLPYTIKNKTYVNRLIRDSLLTWYDTLVIALDLNDSEIQGVCHGIALSMCYGNQNMVAYEKLKKGADCYWKLGNPRDSEAFRDLIVYYQLTQHTANGKATKTLDREGWHFTSLEKRKKEFLESLVSEAKRSQKEKKPFVFSFLYGNGGHSIVACGYRWNEASGQHEIILYDENSYPNAVYDVMKVSSDYRSFQFADANHKRAGKKLEDTWTSLKYFGIDQTYHGISTVSASLSGTGSARTTVQVPMKKKFRLENSKGEWLEYDGVRYTGTMKVYHCVSVGTEQTPIWSLTVDASESFKLTGMEKGCRLICEIGQTGYGVTADGAGSIRITEKSLEIEGNQYHLDLVVQLAGHDFVRMDTEITGDARVTKKGETVQIQAEGSCQNTKVSVYDQGEIQKEMIISPGTTIEYGEIKKPEQPIQKGKTYTAGKFKYKVTALSGGRGSVTLTAPKTKSLTAAVIPDTVIIKGTTCKVTAVGDRAFRGCSKLKSVTFGKYLTKIGKEAFSGDKKLSSIKVRTSSLKTVGSKAFRGIAKKAVFSVPRSKLKAYKKLFSKKAGLTSSMKLKAASSGKVWKVTFKDGQKTVKIQKVANGKSAAAPKLKKKGYLLSWSTSFSKVKKNLTVKAIWTPELPKKGYRKTLGGITYQVTKSAKNGGTVQISGVSDRGKTSYRLPSTVKLGKYRFTVTEIGKGAFQNCKKAKTISLSAGIRKIEKRAFQGTSKNLTVSVPKAAYSSLAKQLKQAGLSREAKIQKR